MADEALIAILRSGSKAWNSWRRQNPGEYPRKSSPTTVFPWEPDLREADFQGASLRGANLQDGNLERANLLGANLERAFLQRARLSGALLVGASLRGADLSFADLSRAALHSSNLEGADLRGANLTQATLDGASLASVRLSDSLLGDLDFRNTEGLESVRHDGPSTLGIDTMFKSAGQIPEVFLRGCGVPDVMIAYVASLVSKPIEYYSAFISYSHKDEAFAQRLHSRMREEGIRVWYAPEDIAGGKKLHEQIDTAIKLHDKLLAVLSEHSMSSEWVMTEIYKARQREVREKRQVLFPISLAPFEEIKKWEYFDADTGKDLAREIREYFVPDFSGWKDHDKFEATFARLVKDLRASEVK